MKLDNKGFAISSIMYIILVMAVILIAVTLALLSSRNLILEKIKDEAINDVYTISFAKDSWERIVNNIKNGKTSRYKVGDTKEIILTGFGTFTVRIANKSTPEECSTSGFSQTACGFVVEFVDIIENKTMNSTATNVGGWKDSAMRTYVNDTIYNALPKELRDKIIDTTVVSGYGLNDAPNKVSTDKLYLLAPKEVWGKEVSKDTASSQTRKLDFYGITTDYSTLKKSGSSWWLRTPSSNSTEAFYLVGYNATNPTNYATSESGVAPAFRIG